MPKFLVAIVQDKLAGRMTIDARDAQAAREQAEMEGFSVTGVSIVAPQIEVEPLSKSRMPDEPKAGVGIQLLCALIGLPGTICLAKASMGDIIYLPGALLLAVVYFLICQPRGYAQVWSTFRGFGVICWTVAVIILACELHALATGRYLGLLGGEPYRAQPTSVAVIEFASRFISVGVLSFIAFVPLRKPK